MKAGFTLIELAFVIIIIGILATMALPRLTRMGASISEQFLTRLNALVSFGAQEALSHGKVEKILFNIKNRTIEALFIDATQAHKTIEIPHDFDITDFYIDGKNQFRAGAGERYSAYFLINSEGISQEVVIAIVDKTGSRTRGYQLYLNPFTVQFKIQ